MPDILTMGEALVDMVATAAGSLDAAPGFVKAAGGAPANVAAAAARFGASSGLIGAVSRDAFGQFLLASLREAGVDTTGTVQVDRPQGLAFVARGPQGERDFLFYGESPAHLHLEAGHLDRGAIAGARVLHYGSLNMAAEPARTAHLEALRAARAAGVLCSYDPNLRPSLWPSRERMLAQVWEGMGPADLLKVSAEELQELAGGVGVAQARQLVRDAGLALCVVTLGSQGAFFVNAEGEGRVLAPRVEAIDTTGAGDVLVAALLAEMVAAGAASAGALRAARPDQIRPWMEFAVQAAALACTRKGVFPALPTRAQVAAMAQG